MNLHSEKQNKELEDQSEELADKDTIPEKQIIDNKNQNKELHNQIQNDIKDIYSQMMERGIKQIMCDDSTSSDLFQSMWTVMSDHYWYGEIYINRFHSREVFCNYYEELGIYLEENIYRMDQRDVVGGEGYYLEGFQINNHQDSFDIIGCYYFSPDSTIILGQLDFNDPDRVKVVMFDKTYIPMDTDMRICINKELFEGDWYDENMTCYTFGTDYKITYENKVESYEPFYYSVSGDYNYIRILDTDGKTFKKEYGYTMTDDTLSFYETMEVDNDSVLCPEPFLILTRKQ